MKKDVLKMKQKRLQDALRDNLRRRKAKITNQDSAGTKIINEDTHDDNMKKSNCSGIKRVCGVILVIALFCPAMLLMQGCTKKREVSYGYSFKDVAGFEQIVSDIKIGVTSEEDILGMLGSPTIISNYGPDTFLYIESHSTVHYFTRPTVYEQLILEIVFDADHIVRSVRKYNMSDYNDKVVYDRDIEAGDWDDVKLYKQIVRNIGRYHQ